MQREGAESCVGTFDARPTHRSKRVFPPSGRMTSGTSATHLMVIARAVTSAPVPEQAMSALWAGHWQPLKALRLCELNRIQPDAQ